MESLTNQHAPDAQKELAREITPSSALNDLVVQLGVTLNRHSMYPSGHPSLRMALDDLLRRFRDLLAGRQSLVIVAARRQLIVDGFEIEGNDAVFRRLTDSLHTLQCGAITLLSGLEGDELSEMLGVLTAESSQGTVREAGQRPNLQWPHITLHPWNFDGLALKGEVSQESGTVGGPESSQADLWLALAHTALSNTRPQDFQVASADPKALAAAINAHVAGDVFDQSISDSLVHIARILRKRSEGAGEQLLENTSVLIANLAPTTWQRLLGRMGDVATQRAFALDAAHGMAVSAVLELVKALAESNGQTISHGLLRMLSKLASQAKTASVEMRRRADGALREQVVDLLTGWELTDPTPDGYGQVLQHLASTQASGRVLSEADHDVQKDVNPLRTLQLSLEVGVFGVSTARALEQLVAAGALTDVVDVICARPSGADDVARTILSQLVQPESLRAFLDGVPADLEALGVLLPHMPRSGVEALFETLASSDVRMIRRRLLDLLTETEVDVRPCVLDRLQDERWYVQRNMLTLLERRRESLDGVSVRPWTVHGDERVRRVAIRLQLTKPEEYEQAVRTALTDASSQIVRYGLQALREHPLPAVLLLVVNLVKDKGLGDELRCLGVSILGDYPQPEALRALLGLVDGGRSLLGRRRLLPHSPLLIAAVRVLAGQWGMDPQVVPVLAIASRSSNAALRQAAMTRSQ